MMEITPAQRQLQFFDNLPTSAFLFFYVVMVVVSFNRDRLLNRVMIAKMKTRRTRRELSAEEVGDSFSLFPRLDGLKNAPI